MIPIFFFLVSIDLSNNFLSFLIFYSFIFFLHLLSIDLRNHSLLHSALSSSHLTPIHIRLHLNNWNQIKNLSKYSFRIIWPNKIEQLHIAHESPLTIPRNMPTGIQILENIGSYLKRKPSVLSTNICEFLFDLTTKLKHIKFYNTNRIGQNTFHYFPHKFRVAKCDRYNWYIRVKILRSGLINLSLN